MADKTITVVLKGPGMTPSAFDVPNTLAEFQAQVDGYIEAIPFEERFVLLMNEEGRAKFGGQPNIVHDVYGTLYGPIVVTKANRAGDFVSLTVQEQVQVIKALRERGAVQP